MLPAALEAVRARGGLVLAQLNPLMPWTFGDALVPVDDIDAGVEIEQQLAVHTPVPPDETAAHIGAQVAAAIGDGATIQAGIGAVPDATVAGLVQRRGLRVWTEMFSDGILALERAGALDQEAPLSTSFVFGSAELYAWLDGNDRVLLRRTEMTNSPAAHRRAAPDDVREHRPPDRPLRAGQRLPYPGADLLGLRRPDRLHRRRPPVRRRARPSSHCAPGTPSRLLDHRAARRRAGDLVPALRGGHRTGGRADRRPDERAQARNLIEHAAHPRVRDELREEARALGLA